jgi:hypothetical protein
MIDIGRTRMTGKISKDVDYHQHPSLRAAAFGGCSLFQARSSREEVAGEDELATGFGARRGSCEIR